MLHVLYTGIEMLEIPFLLFYKGTETLEHVPNRGVKAPRVMDTFRRGEGGHGEIWLMTELDFVSLTVLTYLV